MKEENRELILIALKQILDMYAEGGAPATGICELAQYVCSTDLDDYGNSDLDIFMEWFSKQAPEGMTRNVYWFDNVEQRIEFLNERIKELENEKA